ncbi:hypothetical protein CLPUN_32760 [Clostridium puniceum]|uniref:Uncharacterized protein n=1 Tax=Clostridium puniceum TaxID=29367 RepID=A0A1S8TDG2_9CLOT|nr:BC1881 family protein [Clostridium puniceum]OOM75465.1 hypothetical protein CLPUN_32760 [Clostridium puniceum]
MDLSQVSTKELVNELKSREGIEVITTGLYKSYVVRPESTTMVFVYLKEDEGVICIE